MAQPQRSTADQLEAIVPDFDMLVSDVRLGARTPAHWHTLRDEARRIAAAILAPFEHRERQVHPIRQDRDGRWGG